MEVIEEAEENSATMTAT